MFASHLSTGWTSCKELTDKCVPHFCDPYVAHVLIGMTDTVVTSSSGRPAENRVFFRENRYEPQRVHVIVYNWERLSVVQLDLVSVLSSGQRFQLVEVHDIWGEPVAAGVYNAGDRVAVTMNLQPWSNTTGDGEFGCFILFRDTVHAGGGRRLE